MLGILQRLTGYGNGNRHRKDLIDAFSNQVSVQDLNLGVKDANFVLNFSALLELLHPMKIRIWIRVEKGAHGFGRRVLTYLGCTYLV